MERLFDLLLIIPVLLFSVIVHEVAHGWVALREGDPTAYMLGRLTLNPIPHIDPFGSILFPLLLWVTHAGFIFGWAKPVPVNSRNFKKYKRGDILVSLAGIAANLLLVVAFAIVSLVTVLVAGGAPQLTPWLATVQQVANMGVFINVVLAVFNLIPVPPLDGSHVFYYLLPPRLGAAYRDLGRYGMIPLLIVIFLLQRQLGFIDWPAERILALIPQLS